MIVWRRDRPPPQFFQSGIGVPMTGAKPTRRFAQARGLSLLT